MLNGGHSRNSYPWDKMIPKETLKLLRKLVKGNGCRKVWKKLHNRKTRYMKFDKEV